MFGNYRSSGSIRIYRWRLIYFRWPQLFWAGVKDRLLWAELRCPDILKTHG
jgi:hypothetical protein